MFGEGHNLCDWSLDNCSAAHFERPEQGIKRSPQHKPFSPAAKFRPDTFTLKVNVRNIGNVDFLPRHIPSPKSPKCMMRLGNSERNSLSCLTIWQACDSHFPSKDDESGAGV